jgi:tRNA A-37 threonylcarbamoyl transferase component Bud32
MSESNETRSCPTCGTPIPEGSPGGLCPRCLLSAGIGSGGPAAGGDAPAPEQIAKDFPALEILEVLGEGGMGIVYKARQKKLDRLVALKVLPPEAAREPGFAERFEREARTLARLHHPHVVGVHDFGESNGLYYLVMEYVDGPNLRQVIREGSLSAAQALAIVPQICEALQYAHDHGVVHRDIKPENVLLDRAGNVKIADFGLAKLVQRAPVDLTLTRAGQVMGTLQYMAPEQYKAPDSVDHRADIYSLGVVFYEMLTGELPVGTFPPPSTRPGVDARLDAVVLRALERERDKRWQKASELGTSVDVIASSAAVAPGTTPPPAAVPAAAAAHVVAAPPAAPHAAPRVSRLAVLGALLIPFSLATGVLAGLATQTKPRGVHGPDAFTTGVLATAGTLVTGLMVSVIAWVRIAGSGGRLLGKGWAIVGTILPAVALLVAAPFVTLTGIRIDSDPDSEREAIRRLRDAGPPPGREERAAAAAKVVGAPEGWSTETKAFHVRTAEIMWSRVLKVVQSEPNPDAKALALPPFERARYAAMTSAQRKEAAEVSRLGVAFAGAQDAPWDALRLAWMVLSPDGRAGRLVLATSSGASTVAFPVVYEEATWWPALGAVEIQERPLEDGDRDGWIDSRFFGADRDPADRVTGGPASLSPAARHRIAHLVAEAWRNLSTEALDRDVRGIGRQELYGMRPWHVALEAEGRFGRLVLASDAHTVAFGVLANAAGEWSLATGNRPQVVAGPPEPTDRTGYLVR